MGERKITVQEQKEILHALADIRTCAMSCAGAINYILANNLNEAKKYAKNADKAGKQAYSSIRQLQTTFALLDEELFN